MVSIVCKTYNQQNYIRQAIEGFLIQKTNFNYEILIQDDASTDNAPDIIKEYQQKFPERIKPIFEKKNQFSQGINSHFKNSFSRAKGKYIAICDGDDYWTDELKLQKQVDFLENNTDCNLVFTNCVILDRNGKQYNKFSESLVLPVTMDFKYFFEKKIPFPSTLTIMFKKNIIPYPIPEFLIKAFNGDWAILIFAFYSGKVGYINQTTCVYRANIGILSKTNNVKKYLNGLELNKNLNTVTQFKFDYCLGERSFFYKNLSYSYLQNKEVLNSLSYFLKTISYFYKTNTVLHFLRKTLGLTKKMGKVVIKTYVLSK